MIKPTIGRVVLVSRVRTIAESHIIDPTAAPQPEPALISYVHGDRLISVGGMAAAGGSFSAFKIPLLQDDDEKPEGVDFAYWMPYQKEQAAANAPAPAQSKPAP